MPIEIQVLEVLSKKTNIFLNSNFYSLMVELVSVNPLNFSFQVLVFDSHVRFSLQCYIILLALLVNIFKTFHEILCDVKKIWRN